MQTILAFMKRATTITLFVVAFSLLAETGGSADWLTLPGNYTHDAVSGQRVAQYAPVDLPTAPITPPLRTSGYTHFRSTLAFGQSADNYHRVEQWGDPVRPYGEWRFPFRPYSTPYPNWGPPYAGLNIGPNIGFGFGTGLGAGVGVDPRLGGPRSGGPGLGGPGLGGPGFAPGQRPGAVGPGSPQPGGQAPGFQHGRFPNPAAGTNGLAPYPSGRGTPYPVAPYYDGYYPNYRQ
jgi:hypothetical protein